MALMWNIAPEFKALISDAALSVEGRIFPTLETARAALAAVPKVDGVDFRIAQDGAGRASIEPIIAES
jgi:hypothetical protein